MRNIINMNQNWLFNISDISSSNRYDYDDSLWETVHIPHNVQETPLISSGGRNYQGVCRYRKHFQLEPHKKDEQVILEFEGAMQVMEIWINGNQLPTNYCGYIPAVYDITDFIYYTKDNVLALRLDNSDRDDVPPGKPQSRLDFTYDGGLYRGVKLYQKAPLNITHPLLANEIAGGGIWARTQSITEKEATLIVKTHLSNSSAYTQCQIQHIIKNDQNETIQMTSENVILDHQDTLTNSQNISIHEPILWSPYHPYLYNIHTQIIVDDCIIDDEVTSIGVRQFEFTKDKGFIINGEKIKVSGANYHQTYPFIGNAMPESLLRRDAKKYREAGMIHIRSHYPFAKCFMDECDHLGILLIISSPGWQYFQEGVFADRAYRNLRHMVRWLRNHPSVILWEPGLNESVMPEAFMKDVYNIVHEELPDGPCYTGSDAGFSDVVYRDFDPGMLGPKSEEFDPEAYLAMKKRFDKPRWVREYGDCPDNFTDQNCSWRIPRSWGEDIMLKQVRRMIGNRYDWMSNYATHINNDTLCGFGMWPGMEHNRGYHINPCWGGFLDLLRLPKYSFYLFKSQRDITDSNVSVSSGPMIYIANYWTDVSPDNITVFSNCDKVRLYHNDLLIEEREPDALSIPHPPFTFMNNFYWGRQRSEIRVEGIINGEVVAEDKRFTPGVPRGLELYSDHMGLDLKADGSDAVFVGCNVIDDHGQITPLTLDQHDIIFHVSGPGKIIGDTVKRPELGQTGVLLQATNTPGTITVTAELLHPQAYHKIAITPYSLEIKSY